MSAIEHPSAAAEGAAQKKQLTKVACDLIEAVPGCRSIGEGTQ